MSRSRMLALAATVAGGLGLVSAAQAAPASPPPAGGLAGAPITKVDYYCGPGLRLTPWGTCQPVYRPRYAPVYGFGWGHHHHHHGWGGHHHHHGWGGHHHHHGGHHHHHGGGGRHHGGGGHHHH